MLLNYSYKFDELKFLIEKTAKSIVDSQPEMASILTIANNAVNYIDKLDSNTFCECLHRHFDSEKEKISKSIKMICNHTFDIIPDNSNIFIYSYSLTVYEAIIYSINKGKNFNIFCTESRPMNEGVAFSKKLGEKGINVTLFVDAAIFSQMNNIDYVLTGADAITSNGLVNKIGTYGLLMASYFFHIPSFVLCSTDKILPDLYDYKIFKKNPREIISDNIKNVNPINYYFDITPLKYIKNIITEEGVIDSRQIKKIMKNLKINSIFINDYRLEN